MKLKGSWAIATVAVFAAPTAALAASDYLLQLDGVKGESSRPIEIESWSWGASNPGAASTRLRESPTRASTGGVRVAAGDVNGDGRADLAVVSTVPEVSLFTLRVPAASALGRQCASGKHIASAQITRAGAPAFVLSDATVRSCAAGPRQTVSMTITGQMRHTKSGHVTLLK